MKREKCSVSVISAYFKIKNRSRGAVECFLCDIMRPKLRPGKEIVSLLHVICQIEPAFGRNKTGYKNSPALSLLSLHQSLVLRDPANTPGSFVKSSGSHFQSHRMHRRPSRRHEPDFRPAGLRPETAAHPQKPPAHTPHIPSRKTRPLLQRTNEISPNLFLYLFSPLTPFSHKHSNYRKSRTCR